LTHEEDETTQDQAVPEAAVPDESPVMPDGEAAPPADAGEREPEVSVLPPAEIRAVLEALIFASDQPITAREIGQVLGAGVPREDWEAALEELKAEYARDGRGLQLAEIAGGWQITTRPEYNDWVRELLDPQRPTRLSIQALETLAVIAYKQPVTQPEVIELRGVKSGGVVKTLLEKRLIRITGRKEVVGRPMLYGTTKEFLLHFGLKDLAELPKIEEFAEVLGEEVDVAGLKRAIEAPLPVEIPLAEEGEQMTLDQTADETDAPEAGDSQADGYDDGGDDAAEEAEEADESEGS
jgi:segregation and condensation protein B